MAKKNRDEAIVEVNTKIVPTVTNVTHRSLLNDDILNSTVFEKDVIASETPVAGAVTINYANKDTATVTTTVNLAVSFTNLENGAVKHLVVTKSAANVISFVGANDEVNFRDIINTVETVVVYRVSSKNGIIKVEALFAPDSTTWQNITPEAGLTGTFRYRINNFSGKIEVEINLTDTTGFGTNPIDIGTLPAPIRPNRLIYFPYVVVVPDETSRRLKINNTTGVVTVENTGITWAVSDNFYAYFEYYKTI